MIRFFCLLAFVFCLMLLTGTDAFAFGKRGGFFSRGSSCSSGSCGTVSSGGSYRGASCGTCGPNQCATGCATTCENGQCMPTQSTQLIVGNDGTKYKQVCEGGKCFLVPLETGPTTLGSSPVILPLKPVETVTLHKDGNAWKDTSGNVWKK